MMVWRDPGDKYHQPLNWDLVSKKRAVDLIIERVMDNPVEITILATGMLTNIAHVIAKDPVSMPKAKEIIFMGGAVNVPGNITRGAAEFNVFVDPHAIEIVLNFCVPIIMFPLDVTHQVEFMRERAQKEFGARNNPIPNLSTIPRGLE